MMITKACPKCGGDVYQRDTEYGTEYVCLQAGHEVSFEYLERVMAERKGIQESISEEAKMAKGDIAKYREENKEAIMADYYAMDYAAFLERWNIPDGSWPGLKRKWNMASKPWKKMRDGKAGVDPGDVSLSQRDQYLILVGYQQAIRELIKERVLIVNSRNF